MLAQPCGSVFELAEAWPEACAGPDAATVNRVLQVTANTAKCRMTDQLKQQYGDLEQQLVVSFTNRISHEQAWYNAARGSKPQTFVADGERSMLDAVAAMDTTGGPAGSCDFCDWASSTAEDSFGRIEVGNVVSASNLFKYCAPGHGLLLFKHHDPLSFSASDILQLLQAGSLWFDAAAGAAAAGEATSTHTHGSLGSAQQPAEDRGTARQLSLEDTAASASASSRAADGNQHPDRRLWPLLLWNNLPRAGASQFHGHAQVALSEVPFPVDMHMMRAAAAHAAQHDGACCHDDTWRAHAALGLGHQIGPPDDRASLYASLTPRKDAEIVIHGHSLMSAHFATALHAALRVLVDDLGCPSFNAAVHPMWGAQAPSDMLQPLCRCRVIARVVSRGKISSRASDFGGLEVFAGASIGHTDPYLVHAALGRRLAAVVPKS